MLRVFVKEKNFFSLSYLNERLEGFKWGPDATDHPPHTFNKAVVDDPMNASLKLAGGKFNTIN